MLSWLAGKAGWLDTAVVGCALSGARSTETNSKWSGHMVLDTRWTYDTDGHVMVAVGDERTHEHIWQAHLDALAEVPCPKAC
eukprot:1150689-Pelagomonas_calceolata.AAC.6